MMQSGMMPYIILSICIIFLLKKVGTQVIIPATTSPSNGETVILTCYISPFTLPASWKNSDNGATITTCFSNSACSPSSDGVRYNFSVNASSIVVMISRFNSTIDTFTWKCEHSGIVAVYCIVAAPIMTTTPNTTVTTTPNTTVTTAPNTAVTTAPSTTVTTAPSTTVTTAPNTAVTTTPDTAVKTTPRTADTTTLDTAVTSTPKTAVTTTPNTTAYETVHATTLPQSQHAVIIGVTVVGSVLILGGIIICCCYCPCCYLSHCWNRYRTDLDNQDAMKKKRKLNDGALNLAYSLSNEPIESSTYAASQTSTSQNSMIQV